MVVFEELESSCAFSPIIQHHLFVLEYKDEDIEELFENFSALKKVILFCVIPERRMKSFV